MDALSKALLGSNVVARFLSEEDVFRGLSLKGPKMLFSSAFTCAVFEDCSFEGLSMTAVYFDHCLFSGCSFTGLDLRYCVFAGSAFRGCSFTDSTSIATNFMGIDIYGSDFSSNDFYFSDFSLAEITESKMEDCNLKRASFRGAAVSSVSFRYSNVQDALYLEERL